MLRPLDAAPVPYRTCRYGCLKRISLCVLVTDDSVNPGAAIPSLGIRKGKSTLPSPSPARVWSFIIVKRFYYKARRNPLKGTLVGHTLS